MTWGWLGVYFETHVQMKCSCVVRQYAEDADVALLKAGVALAVWLQKCLNSPANEGSLEEPHYFATHWTQML